MDIEYKNGLIISKQYRKMLLYMSALIIGMCAFVVGLSYFRLSRIKPKVSPEKYIVETKRVQKVSFSQTGLAFFVVASMFGIAHIKKKTSIITTKNGIEYKNILGSTFIPWDDIKDIKVKLTGTSSERCTIRGNDGKRISFNSFMLDKTKDYDYLKDGIFDEHGNKITYSIKKSKLYKEVKMKARIKPGKKKQISSDPPE
ncbi:MAG: PH domain-containing protein [Candidatus Eremiobacteraeota bacterium]|nr:PH domain-containing protein [Candidatus Eremiobacteraeota bacterium]